MTAKEYLNQAHWLDVRIASKLEQLDELEAMVTRMSVTFKDEPESPNRDLHRNERIMNKIIDLHNEVQSDMEELIELKHEIMAVIKRVDNPEYQTLLEKRYLCSLRWEEIAVDMGYSIESVYRVHRAALNQVRVPE